MDVADMTGKTVVITGGNSGSGSRRPWPWPGRGPPSVITARDRARGEAALTNIRARSRQRPRRRGGLRPGLAGLDPPGAAAILERCRPHRRARQQCRAGADPAARDGGRLRGHLRHQPSRALPPDRAAARSHQGQRPGPHRQRGVHRPQGARTGLDFDDIQTTRGYVGMRAYSKSKLANIYFTTELARRLEGTGVDVNCLHPGTVARASPVTATPRACSPSASRSSSPSSSPRRKGPGRRSTWRRPPRWPASGRYFVKCKARTPSKAARDDEAAARLWKVSEESVAAPA